MDAVVAATGLSALLHTLYGNNTKQPLSLQPTKVRAYKYHQVPMSDEETHALIVCLKACKGACATGSRRSWNFFFFRQFHAALRDRFADKQAKVVAKVLHQSDLTAMPSDESDSDDREEDGSRIFPVLGEASLIHSWCLDICAFTVTRTAGSFHSIFRPEDLTHRPPAVLTHRPRRPMPDTERQDRRERREKREEKRDKAGWSEIQISHPL